ncbi:hypothetical protein M8J76_002423 [Diaphorina citri]|nr:hypothetical protein M8J76_002423 [Diaphorina citri]
MYFLLGNILANLTTRGRKVREVTPESRILDNGTPTPQQDPNPRSIAQQQDPNPPSIAQQQDPNPRSIAQQQDIRLAEGTRDSTVIYQRQKRTKYVTLTTRSRFTPTTPSPIIRTYIAHASESGTAEKYAHRLHDILMTKFNTSRRPGRKLFSSQVVNVEALLWIDAAELVLFVASTTGEGDPPRNARRYYDNCLLFRYFDHLPYHNVYYAVLGLGSKLYKSNFCAFGVNLDKMTGDLGGTRILPVEKADTLDLEETFTRWVGAVVPHVDRICRSLPVQHVVDNSTAPPGVTEKNIMEQMNRMAATAGVSLVLTLRKSTTRSPNRTARSTKVTKAPRLQFKTTTVNITWSTFVPTARFYLNPFHKHLEDMFNTYAVLLFTNHNCEKSALAKAAFARYNFTNYEEKVVNRRGDQNAILDTLLILTGTRSVPKCWIRGQYVGNHRRLNRLADTGELGVLLKGLDEFRVYVPVSYTEAITTTTEFISEFYYDEEAHALRDKFRREKNLTDSQINELYGG